MRQTNAPSRKTRTTVHDCLPGELTVRNQEQSVHQAAIHPFSEVRESNTYIASPVRIGSLDAHMLCLYCWHHLVVRMVPSTIATPPTTSSTSSSTTTSPTASSAASRSPAHKGWFVDAFGSHLEVATLEFGAVQFECRCNSLLRLQTRRK